jgi:hypoxia up-regulated 1
MDDVDFKAKVTREEFEQMCADLFERVKNPINDAIKTSEVIHDELTTVILVGGSTRIPKVQDELMKATKKYVFTKN